MIKEEKTNVVPTESREILNSLGEAYPPFQVRWFYKVRVQMKAVKRKHVKTAGYRIDTVYLRLRRP